MSDGRPEAGRLTHVRPDGSQQLSGRSPAAQQVTRLTTYGAEPAG